MRADWLADHPGRTVEDAKIAGTCSDAPEGEAAWCEWSRKRYCGHDPLDAPSRPPPTSTASAEVSTEQRRAANARLDDEETNENSEPGENTEVASPAVIEENVLYSLQRVNEHARLFKKLFKASTFDREAKERINTAIDRTIQKLRSTQAALGLFPDSTGAGERPR